MGDLFENPMGLDGFEFVEFASPEPAVLAAEIRERFGIEAAVIDGSVRLEQPDGHAWVPRLATISP